MSEPTPSAIELAPGLNSRVAHSARLWNYLLWVARTTSPLTGRRPKRCSPTCRSWCSPPAATAASSAARSPIWPARPSPPVPGHRDRPADRQQHARGRAGRGTDARASFTWTTTRWSCPRPALLTSRPGGEDRLHRRRPARPGADPARGRSHAGLHRADRRHAARQCSTSWWTTKRPTASCAAAWSTRYRLVSYLVLSHPTEEVQPEAVRRAMKMWNESGAAPITARDQQEIGRFFTGLTSWNRAWSPVRSGSRTATIPSAGVSGTAESARRI